MTRTRRTPPRRKRQPVSQGRIRVKSMDSTTDPLEKSERLLREILEGQRLSRLDGVVFLSCPLLVAGITFLANQIQQLRFSDKIDFIFHGLSLLLMILILGYVAWGFIAYVRSSLANDIKGRARSCRKLLWGFSGLSTNV